MESFFLTMVLKPFFALIVFGLICLPARLAVAKYMKDGRLKRALLTRIGD